MSQMSAKVNISSTTKNLESSEADSYMASVACDSAILMLLE